jgi:hypothetical protein
MAMNFPVLLIFSQMLTWGAPGSQDPNMRVATQILPGEPVRRAGERAEYRGQGAGMYRTVAIVHKALITLSPFLGDSFIHFSLNGFWFSAMKVPCLE